jgi:hypothetical protein
MTLQDLLQRYHLENSDNGPRMLYDEYNKCDKEALVDNFKVCKAQKAEDNAPTKVKNISISKKVYAKLKNITTSVCCISFPEHISYPLFSARNLINYLGLRLPSFIAVALVLILTCLVHL